ncbi:LANO_0D02344g1_1 [Lachancea nothofagi CBS 11611]|uniref:LANO_0D02344g1_1 n=1 Tax=Lachancea nothofagi CBS 11611 TaxID=1266666 RepID=A0A1G4JE75_9SACH|nr:LANO_0D02344g1_1 [Lachancea nothofagi CBS 11611]
MARIWREYKAPDGSKYYYNVKSQQSTREKPADFEDHATGARKSRKTEPQAIYHVTLANNWSMVVCENGSRFFDCKGTLGPQQELDDDESAEILSQIGKEKLALLAETAQNGGGKDSEIYKEILKAVDRINAQSTAKEIDVAAENENEETDAEESGSDSDVSKVSGEESGSDSEVSRVSEEDNLVSGYASSEDEESEEHEPDVILAPPDEANSQNQQAFISLFEQYSLDPYSTWNMQSKKIQDDALFYKISSDATRQGLFDKWCTQQFHDNNDIEKDLNESDVESVETESEQGSDDLEPTKYHYLSHIVSKANILPTTLAKDVRVEQKALFRQFKIKDTLDKKTQEEFISKLLFYYKKLTPEERSNVFDKLLNSKLKVIKNGLRNTGKLKELASQPDLPKESYAIESQLLELEDCMDFHGSNKFLQEDIQYYVLGIKPKTIALKQFLHRNLA